MGQRPGVPRFGIKLISRTSSAYISVMMATPTMAVSSSTWRAERRAASARRECEGGRTICAHDAQASVKNRDK